MRRSRCRRRGRDRCCVLRSPSLSRRRPRADHAALSLKLPSCSIYNSQQNAKKSLILLPSLSGSRLHAFVPPCLARFSHKTQPPPAISKPQPPLAKKMDFKSFFSSVQLTRLAAAFNALNIVKIGHSLTKQAFPWQVDLRTSRGK